jgi:hypothetical protein
MIFFKAKIKKKEKERGQTPLGLANQASVWSIFKKI